MPGDAESIQFALTESSNFCYIMNDLGGLVTGAFMLGDFILGAKKRALIPRGIDLRGIDPYGH